MKNKTSNIRREDLAKAIALKRKCSQIAQNIVIELIEAGITEEHFLSKLRYILPFHYEDIIEERFILKLCGYPLCSTRLENIAYQKYVVSPIVNKVYDISERKKFCSGECFNASNYIKDQIPTCPLWLRKDNTFNLKILTSKNQII